MASSMSSTTESSTSYWIKFFTDAGVPAGDAANYAVAFCDNRIQKDMLMDLSKEYLRDMGITLLGDVIAILKHAKTVHTQEARDKVLKCASPSVATAPSNSPSQTRRSTAASRMVDHYIRKDPESAPMNQVGTPRPEPLDPVSKRSSVFHRLGSDSPQQVTVTGLGKVVLRGSSPSSSVFNRLGDKSAVKRAASSTSLLGESDEDDEEDSVLKYAGVLKSPQKKTKLAKPSNRKAASITTATHKVALKKKFTIQTSEVSTTSTSSAGTLSSDHPLDNLPVRQRLGKKVVTAAASSTTSTSAASPTITVRLGGKSKTQSSLAADKSVKSRLGPKAVEESQKKVVKRTVSTDAGAGVFGRLGKKQPS